MDDRKTSVNNREALCPVRSKAEKYLGSSITVVAVRFQGSRPERYISTI